MSLSRALGETQHYRFFHKRCTSYAACSWTKNYVHEISEKMLKSRGITAEGNIMYNFRNLSHTGYTKFFFWGGVTSKQTKKVKLFQPSLAAQINIFIKATDRKHWLSLLDWIWPWWKIHTQQKPGPVQKNYFDLILAKLVSIQWNGLQACKYQSF